jgi:hypothetical protein
MRFMLAGGAAPVEFDAGLLGGFGLRIPNKMILSVI